MTYLPRIIEKQKKARFNQEVSPTVITSIIDVIDRIFARIAENITIESKSLDDAALSAVMSLISNLISGDGTRSLCCPSDFISLLRKKEEISPPKQILRGIENDENSVLDIGQEKKAKTTSEVSEGTPLLKILISSCSSLISKQIKINILKFLLDLLRCPK